MEKTPERKSPEATERASRARCTLCPHACVLAEGKTGRCKARINRDGTVVSLMYGILSSLALDPIEKKPLRRFHPGTRILSAGSFGCNLTCPFCQNASIADLRDIDLPDDDTFVAAASSSGTQAASDAAVASAAFGTARLANAVHCTPKQLVDRACALRAYNNIGIAYTYNEPLINFEYVLDCARLAAQRGLVNVIVSNGFIDPDALARLLPFVDAANIDLKGFTSAFYRKLGGSLCGLDAVLRTIETLSQAPSCHLEVTTLVIPGENDSDEEIDAASAWLASCDPAIPYHLSRFFPCHRMADRDPTPVATIYRLARVARRHLAYVYTGNC